MWNPTVRIDLSHPSLAHVKDLAPMDVQQTVHGAFVTVFNDLRYTDEHDEVSFRNKK